jgi:hypothetical protein
MNTLQAIVAIIEGLLNFASFFDWTYDYRFFFFLELLVTILPNSLPL